MILADSAEVPVRNVVFVAPFPMPATLRFAAGIRSLKDVRLIGLFQQPPAEMSGWDWLHIVPDALDPDVLTHALQALTQKFGKIHHVAGILENIQEPLAIARQRLGIEGTDLQTATRFRDKGVMKDHLRAHGVPCARHARLRNEQDAWEFVRQVGFPIVIKPPSGAGAKATWRVRDAEELRGALSSLRPSPQNEILAEEFLRGREFSFETITLNNRPVFTSISRYLPTPLEVLENPWIQWVCLLPRDVSGPEYRDAHALGQRVIDVMRPGFAVTHMEWFRREDGSLAVGEIAMRPPGASISAMTGLVHDVDFHRAWARCAVDHQFDGPWERKFSAGVAFLRGQGRGRVAAVRGVDEAQRLMGQHVVEAKLPVVGAPKADGYEGDGYVVVRHPDTAVVERALETLIQTVQVVYA
ncbi:MAG: ATP-grasp domain-containing protein [Deltaproteobacteria bacterium]|nr:ATP-grasp domain-containing protein [Deltaproteobacteria bacterium]MBK9645125.1 ATP-grasp domain-containing protein [Deltaproteobacteria bacterium]